MENRDFRRARFINYVSRENIEFHFFLVERILNDIRFDGNRPTWTNLSWIEKRVAELADCVVIFPESPGSFAEVGFFSGTESVRTITLLVTEHDSEYQQDSFLTLGPFETFDAHSSFRSRVYISKFGGEDIWDFQPIVQRLRERLGKKTSRTAIDLTDYKLLSSKHKLYLFQALVEVLKISNKKMILDVLIFLYGNGDYYAEINFYLAILVNHNYVKKAIDHDEYYISNPEQKGFIEIDGFNVPTFGLRFLDLYQTKSKLISHLWDSENEV